MNLIVIPVHPRHFHWVYQLLESAKGPENIALVFSSQEDADSFQCDLHYLSLISDPHEDHCIPIVTWKKLSALRQVKDQYEYVAVIDAECLFLKLVTPHLEEIWNEGILANYADFPWHSCIGHCEIKDYPYDRALYWWFSNIPVYPTRYLSHFFAWLEARPAALSHDKAFDYLVFILFMISEYDLKLQILDVKVGFNIIEELGDCRYEQHRHLVSKTSWSTWFPGVEEHANVRMLFHLDRFPKP